MDKRANGAKNCPNCGAPITSETCEYCGTVFIDVACIKLNSPFYLRVELKGRIYVMPVIMTCLDTYYEPESLYVSSFDTQNYSSFIPGLVEPEITMKMRVIGEKEVKIYEPD